MRPVGCAAWVVLGVVVVSGGIIAAIPRAQSVQSGSADVPVAKAPLSVAAPGRVEGAFDTVEVGTAITAVVSDVFGSEGQIVQRGDILARLECRDLEAELLIRSAETASFEAQLALAIAGPRVQEIGAARADVQLAAARRSAAEASLERNAILVKQAVASREHFDQVQRDQRVAEAQLESTKQHLQQLESGSRPEEIAIFSARLNSANASVAQTTARLDRCNVRSPVSGTILRKQVSVGELISVTAPHPLFSITDLSHVRVRVEVDERDIGRLRVGQAAEVRLPANSSEAVSNGIVVSVSPRMGRRQVLTGDPAEKSDHDIQEVIVALNSRAEDLPVGLRVSVFFSADGAPASTTVGRATLSIR
jgi:HlyD family secretion protein